MGLDKNLTQLIKIGNSTGIIIKKKVLKEAGIQEHATLKILVVDGSIIIKPVKEPARKI